MKELYKAFNMLLSMFTIIPLPKYEWDEKSARHIMKLYPIVGLIIGVIWFVIYSLLLKYDVNLVLSSSILSCIPFILTGFLHLDGFMDVCDAILSRRPKEIKLKILKDSTVGAFSVISLVLLLLISFSALNSLVEKKIDGKMLILIPIASRALVAYFIITKDMISESYFGKLFKNGTTNFDKIMLLLTYILTLILSYFIFDLKGLLSIISLGLCSIILLKKCIKELGGINGDIAGYILVLSEFSALFVLALI